MNSDVFEITTLDGVVIAEGSLEDTMRGADMLRDETAQSFLVRKKLPTAAQPDVTVADTQR